MFNDHVFVKWHVLKSWLQSLLMLLPIVSTLLSDV